MEIVKGFIYVVVNPAFPKMVKIGHTLKAVYERVYELSNSSGIPEKFIVAFEKEVSNPKIVESLIHKELDIFRVNPNREFFEISITQAINTVLKISKEYEIKPLENSTPAFLKTDTFPIFNTKESLGKDFYLGIVVRRWEMFKVSLNDHPHIVKERRDENPYSIGSCTDKNCGQWRGTMIGSVPAWAQSVDEKLFGFTVVDDLQTFPSIKDESRYCVIGKPITPLSFLEGVSSLGSGDGALRSLFEGDFRRLQFIAKKYHLEHYLDTYGIYFLDSLADS